MVIEIYSQGWQWESKDQTVWFGNDIDGTASMTMDELEVLDCD